MPKVQNLSRIDLRGMIEEARYRQWDGLRHTLGPQVSTFLCRLAAPLRWWKGSTVRRVVFVIYSLPSRIRAAVGVVSKGHMGWPIPLPSVPLPGGMYPDSSIRCIEALRVGRTWMGETDLHMAAEAYARGIEDGFRIGSETRKSA